MAFAWSWADYEVERRKWEREQKAISGDGIGDADPAPDDTRDGGGEAPARVNGAAEGGRVIARARPPARNDEHSDDDDDDFFEARLQYCKSCGKKRMTRCLYGGCPLL